MDGYSVKDAAVVLGIPERRVWELLARGVLAGAPEGPDGMIVFLQPKSAPASVSASAGGTAPGDETADAKVNGNGGSGELSPFRELLTEFRNLTERYGQALLALGEARGEVASLRSRVDLLEARMDLRLPSSPPASTVTWEIPEFTAEAPAPSAEPDVGPEQPMAFEADAPIAEEPMDFEADAPLAEEPVANEADVFLAEAAAEVEESVAGEDEPAAEPMIDLVDEVVIAEAVLGEDEQPAEPIVDEVAADEEADLEAAFAASVSEAMAAEEMEAEAFEADAMGETSEPEPEPAEIAPQAAIAEHAGQAEEPSEPTRGRARGGRAATAAFAAALARADDPTIAELPGAEETAAALAALQREIDASRVAELPVEAEAGPIEPEAELAPETEVIEAEPIEPEAGLAPETGVIDAEPEVGRPPSVPSYYSTDVVEPDWFADGDFSWLEAAQAEEMRLQAAQSEAPAAAAEAPVEEADASVQQAEPESQDEAESGQDAVAIDADEGAAAIADELAFGEHPATEAERPDLGHGGFEPSVASQAMAEDEARAAIGEAFDEAPASEEQESADPGPVGLATAVAEPEIPPEVAEGTAWDAADAEPRAAIEPEPQPEIEAEAEAPADEAVAAALEAEDETAEDSPEAEAIQDAFEPSEAPADEEAPAAENVHAGHEAEVEAEAIQEAFEEPMPSPEWPAAATATAADEAPEPSSEPPPVADEPPPVAEEPPAVAYEPPPVAYEPPAVAGEPLPPVDDSPRAFDDGRRTMAAASAATAERGPEEFIAPSPPAIAAPGPAPAPQPAIERKPASGEEELMWLGDEFEEAGLEVAAQGWRSPDAAAATPAGQTPALELSDAELTQLAEDEGWDLEEVEAIRRLLGRPSDAPPPAPTSPTASSDAGETGEGSTLGADPRPSAQGSPSTPGLEPSSPPLSDPADDPEWLEGRGGAAAEAYRRLRKLFPS